MWIAIGRETVHKLSSGGWIANFVIGLAFLLLSPVLGRVMQRPKAAIVSAAVGATVLIWVVAWAAYRSVPNDKPESDATTAPASSTAPTMKPDASQSAQSSAPIDHGSVRPQEQSSQNVDVTNSPGTAIFQAGRDVVVQSPATPKEMTIRSLTVEVRLTCVLKGQHGELPPDEVPFMPVGDANAYLEGAAGRQRLTFISPVRFRKLADNRVVVVNRFALDPGGDLINQPIKVLSNYEKVSTPVITIVWGKEFEKFTLLELSISLNGADPAYFSWTYDTPFQQGPMFGVPFENLRKQLFQRAGV